MDMRILKFFVYHKGFCKGIGEDAYDLYEASKHGVSVRSYFEADIEEQVMDIISKGFNAEKKKRRVYLPQVNMYDEDTVYLIDDPSGKEELKLSQVIMIRENAAEYWVRKGSEEFRYTVEFEPADIHPHEYEDEDEDEDEDEGE